MAEQHKVLLAGADERDLTQLAEYQAIGGYLGVEKARAMTSDALIAELSAANLRGRGGAGFPMGRKASLIDRKSPKPKYLVVNADESEPGAFKDREVMARVPHRLIEGCLIAAHAIESTDVFIYIRGEYLAEYEILQAAADEAREAGIFGDVTIIVHRGAGAYICGEETALLESLEGKRGQPRPRPPFPPIQGLYAAPTQINNVCTIATVPVILELGAEEFAKTGVPSSPGTAIFSVSGNVVRPGNYELELGTPMRELIYEHAG
ncbi:MAG TPA: SLBB domain-containing protein, partial [Gaiellaceae bacterium]